MSNYIFSIKTAFLIFPIVAFLITIPFILIEYHKYGSIHKFRTFIIYSFILYLMVVYFLVILPLPPRESVVYKEGMIRTHLFSFIGDFLRESSFVWNDPSTYLKSLCDPSFYTVIFNIFMTIPFGMYLRYYFKCDFKNTCFYSFLLSLFFEVTQLTGLYFLYQYPYRVFDVDDLLMNTLGGALGYIIMKLFLSFLPSRDRMDAESFKEGKNVSALRRITLFCFDFFLFFLSDFFLLLFTIDLWWHVLWFGCYFVLIPFLKNGKTIGAKFLNVRLEFQQSTFIFSILRILFLLFYYIIFPISSTYFFLLFVHRLHAEALFFLINVLFVMFFFFLFYLIHVVFLIKRKKLYYDRWFGVTYQSTIQK